MLDLAIEARHKLLTGPDDQGVVDSFVTDIFSIIDDGVYFLRLGADSSLVDFLSLIRMNWTLLRRNLIHRSRKVSPMHLRVGRN